MWLVSQGEARLGEQACFSTFSSLAPCFFAGRRRCSDREASRRAGHPMLHAPPANKKKNTFGPACRSLTRLAHRAMLCGRRRRGPGARAERRADAGPLARHSPGGQGEERGGNALSCRLRSQRGSAALFPSPGSHAGPSCDACVLLQEHRMKRKCAPASRSTEEAHLCAREGQHRKRHEYAPPPRPARARRCSPSSAPTSASRCATRPLACCTGEGLFVFEGGLPVPALVWMAHFSRPAGQENRCLAAIHCDTAVHGCPPKALPACACCRSTAPAATPQRWQWAHC